MASARETDCYRPRYETDVESQGTPPDVKKPMEENQGTHGQGCSRPPRGGEFTFRQGLRPRNSYRPLLTEMRASSPELLFRAEGTKEKFRQVNDVSEEEKDVSRFDDDEEQRPSKRLRSGPSWSNPDPYTALPPVTETQKKKQDVVRLIRRSRVTPPPQSTNLAGANGEDFISLDMGGSALEIKVQDRTEPPVNAPTGPKTEPSGNFAQPGKRKRDVLDDISKLPPRANKGARLHQRGRILQEWQASDLKSSTPWYRPPVTPGILAGIA